MNKTFHSVWNAAKQTYVAAAESVSSRGKPSSGKKVAAVLATLMGPMLSGAQAQQAPPPNTLPTGGQVSSGQAHIGQNGANMVIQQSTDRAAINWQTFNVGKDAQVQFQQPGASSVTLNRVLSNDPSQIFGRITANGQVILTNPSGVYFGRDARVDVGGLIATTKGISDADFMAGKSRFERNGSTGSVINEGELKAKLGGYIALLAPEVRNEGAIIAHMGTVALASGEAVDLQFDSNNRLTSIRVEPSLVRALVDNRRAVEAPGGLIILSAQSLDRLLGGVVKNSGHIEASGLQQQGGRIVLSASKRVENTGTIAANAMAGAEGGPAGKIELSAPEVINTGSISAMGNAAQSGGTVQVQATNYTQTATGSMDLSAGSQGGALSLQATGNIQLQGQVNVAATHDSTPANVPTQGGQIDITAQGDIEATDAVLDASGGQGGGIHLRAAGELQPGQLQLQPQPQPQPDAPSEGRLAMMGNTSLSVRGRQGQSGHATLLGDHIDLLDTTRIEATGATGGGTVLVGGDWQGANGVYQASTVSMTEGASIDASATTQGDGGTVVMWSDVKNSHSVTTVNGSILAKGGQQSGDGGQIETSGQQLGIEGIRVDAGSPQGSAGLWLLDPFNYTINAAAAASIGSALDTSNVTVTTTSSVPAYGGSTNAADAGDILLTANIAKTATSGTTTLTLMAHRRINMQNFSIGSAAGGPLNVVLWANRSNGAPGSSTAGGVSALGSITTHGGMVWVGGGLAETQVNGISVPNGPSVGGINANHFALDWSGAINTAGGNVTIWAGQGLGEQNFLAANPGASINAGSGNVTIRARDFNVSSGWPLITTTGNITIRPDTDDGSFSRAINIDWFNFSGATPSSLQIGAPGNTADISSSLPQTINGPISFYGGNINVFRSLQSTAAGANVLLKGTGSITIVPATIHENVSLNTNGGSVTLWSDSDAVGGGYVSLLNFSMATAGGAIVLGGGSDISTGYAKGVAFRDTFTDSVNRLYYAGVHLRSGVNLNSGGGNITLRGQNAGGSDSALSSGVWISSGNVINAGIGRITIQGYATGSGNLNAQAITTAGVTLRSSSTATQAITLVGDATGTSGSVTSLGINFAGLIEATGTGGGIHLTGRATSASNYSSGIDINGSVLARSGPITLIGDNIGGGRAVGTYEFGFLGARPGTNVTSSSSAIVIKGGAIDVFNSPATTRFATTGTVTLAPLDGASGFTNDRRFGNLGLDSSVSGLTIGNNSSLSNIHIDNPITIAGPISLYGGNVYLNAGLRTTASGSGILLKAYDSMILGVGSALSVQTNNGPITLWADQDVNGGFIAVRENVVFNSANGSTTQTTGGGRITLAGGNTTDSDGMPTGYAFSPFPWGVWGSNKPSGVQFGAFVWDHNGGSINNDIRIYSGGGNVLIQGKANNGSPGVSWYGGASASATQLIDAGAGTITLKGESDGHGIELGYYGGALTPTLRSSSNSTTAIGISGKSTETIGVLSWAGYQGSATLIASGTGGISVQGENQSTVYQSVLAGALNMYAAGGDIRVTGIGGTGISIGGSFGKGTLAVSSSNITFTSNSIGFQSGASLNTTGSLTLQSHDASFAANITWPLSNLSLGSTLGGLTIGKNTNTRDITLGSALTVNGPVNLNGATITLNADLSAAGNVTVAASGGIVMGVGANLSGQANISLLSNNGFSTAATSGTTRGRVLTNGGNLHINADADNNNSGVLDLDWLTIDSSAGNLLIEGASFNWSTASGVTYPELYGTGALTIRPVSSSSASMSSQWFGIYQARSAMTWGFAGMAGNIFMDACITCNDAAINYTGKTWATNGPVTLFGSAVQINTPLSTTSASTGNISITTGGLSGTGNLSLASGRTLSVNQLGTSVYAGTISGTGVALTKSGAGRLALTASNTYTGGTTLSAGTLGVHANSALGTGALSMAAGTTLLLGRAVTEVANSITLSGAATVDLDTDVEYLVVGGGGGGRVGVGLAGGGGGGGSALIGTHSMAPASYAITVGAGGFGGPYAGDAGQNGGSSSIATLIAQGGGGASTGNGASSGQGFAGGASIYLVGGGGGGGAAGVGGSAGSGRGGAGGLGLLSALSGTEQTYGAGGRGGDYTAAAPFSAVANSGGGGGGANNDHMTNGGSFSSSGGNGGSGIVIARYIGATAATAGATAATGQATAGTGSAAGYTLHSFTTTGANTLTFNAINPVLSGAINGTGSLTVAATDGRVTLSGGNTYSGGTTITGGVLRVGNAGTAGSLGTGAVVNNAALELNRTDAFTVANAISGTGSLTKLQSNTASLTGANTYTGSTTISAGTLQVGSGGTSGALGTGAVSVAAGATLSFNRSDNLTIDYAISGAGSVAKQGTNTLVFTANSTYTGATTINGGTLVLRNDAPTRTTSGFNGTGALIVESASTSFSGAFSSSGWTFANTLTGITLGKDGNAQAITVASTLDAAGPISIYGSTVTLNAAVTTSNATTGNVLVKTSGMVGSSGITLAIGRSLTVDQSGASTYSGAISGTNATLTKLGPGNLTLSGSSSYTGGTTLTAGNLTAGDSNALGTGALSMAGSTTLFLGNGVTLANNITLGGAATLDLTGSTAVVGGVISGGAALTLDATDGTLSMAGNNLYTGGTTLSGGTVQVGNAGSSGTLGTGAIVNNATLALNRTGAFTLAQNISGTGSLTKLQANTATLTGNNSYSGTTTVSAGTLEIGSGGTAGRLGTGAVAVATGATLQINRSDNLTLAQAISGNGALTKSGSNTLTLTGALTYTGTTTISGGTLVLSNDAPSGSGWSFAGTGALRIEPTGTDFSGPFTTTGWTFPSTLGGLTIGKPSSADGTNDRAVTIDSAISMAGPVNIYGAAVTLSANVASTEATTGNIVIGTSGLTGAGNLVLPTGRSLTVTQSGNSIYSGVISGTNATMTKQGAGTLSLDATQTYSGLTTISAGTLEVGAGSTTGALSNGAIVNNATLQFNRSNALTFSNNISGTGGVTKLQANTITLTGNNTYSGTTTISAGTLQIGSGSTTGTLGTGAVSNSATLQINRSDNVTLANDISGTGNLSKLLSNTVTVTGNNTFSGTTTIGAGTLQVGDGGTAGTLGTSAVNIGTGNTLLVNRSDNLTLANAISGAGALTKSGSNTLTLSGALTYTGVSTISGGSLVLSNNAPTALTGSIDGPGALRIESVADDFTDPFSTSGWTFGATLGGLTIGKATGADGTTDQSVTMATTTSIAGPITVYGGSVTLSANLTTSLSGAALLLKASGNIIQAAGVDVSTQNGKVTYWADSDSIGGGRIELALGTSGDVTSIATSGGDIVLGGGPNPLSGNASNAGANAYVGVNLAGYGNLNAGTGAISIRGANAGTGNNASLGVNILTGSSLQGGDISITGSGSASSGSLTGHHGVLLQSATVTAGGTLSITGTGGGSNSTGGSHHGIYLDGSTLVSTGATSITGTGGGKASGGTDNDGIYMAGGSSIRSGASTLTLTGTAGLNGSSEGITLTAGAGVTNTLGSTESANQSGSIVLRANSYSASATGTNRVQTTGSVTVEPLTGSDSFSSTFSTSGFTFGSTISGLTIGKSTNIANVTIAASYGPTVAGPITIYGGLITVRQNITTSATVGEGISLYGTRIDQQASTSSQGANIRYQVSNGGTTSGDDNLIYIANASFNANGGDIDLSADFSSAASTIAGGDRAIQLTSVVNLITSGTGRITLRGDATNNPNTTSTAWGVQLGNSVRIQSASGDISITGMGGKLSSNSRGIASDGSDLALTSPKVLSTTGAITLIDQKPAGRSSAYSGMYVNPYGNSNFQIGADGSNVVSSSSAVTIRADNLNLDDRGNTRTVAVNTSGAVVVESAGASFEVAPELKGLRVTGSPSSVRIGKTSNTQNITLGSAISAAGPISVYGGTIAVNANLTSTLSGAAILVKASGDIDQAVSVDVSTQGGKVTYWSDSDNSGNGGIILRSGVVGNTTSVTTNGGDIVFGGGTDPLTGYAIRTGTTLSGGVNLANYSSLDADTGAISLRGSNVSTGANFRVGVYIFPDSVVRGGAISMVGTSSPNSADFVDNIGVVIFNSTVTASGALSITGTGGGGGSTGANNHGVFLFGSTLTSEGATNITGTGGGQSGAAASTNNDGVFIRGSSVSSGSSSLNITGTAGFNGSSEGISFISGNGNNTVGSSSSAAQSGAITLRANNWAASTLVTNLVQTTGAVTVESLSGSSSFNSAFSTSGLTFGSTITGLTLGKSNNTAAVTVANALSVAGPITVYGGAIAVNAAMTATGNINLFASGSVSQTAAITAAGLGLNGAGSFTLNNASNSVGTLAGGSSSARLGSLSFVNNAALSISSVNPTGIFAVGDVSVRSTGNLTLSQSINTLSASTTAVVLEAGMNEAVGSFAAGNVLISGSPSITTGSGGRAVLYTGGVNGSTGVTTLVGSGSGRFRYNSKLGTSNFLTPLSAGLNAVYREQPSLNLEAVAETLTYGESPTLTTALASGTATVNGDAMSSALPSLPSAVVFDATNTTAATLNGSGFYDAGAYKLRMGTVSSPLGYAVAVPTAGDLTVNRRNVTVTANNASKFYSQLDPAGLGGVSYSGLARGEITAGTPVTASRAAGETAANYAITASGAATSTNYNITYASGGMFTIVPMDKLTVSIGATALDYGTEPIYTVTSAKYVSAPNSITVSVANSANFAVGETVTLKDANNATLTTAKVLEKSASGVLTIQNQGAFAGVASVVSAANTSYPVTASNVMAEVALNLTDPNGGRLSTGNSLSFTDASSNVITLHVDAIGTRNSNNRLNVGSYVLQATDITKPAGVLTGGLELVGNLNVTPKTVSLVGSKTYDGSSELSGSQLTVSTGVSGEALTFSNAVANSQDAGARFVSGITLANGTGGLLSNYRLPNLGLATTGVNQVTIGRRALSVSATKVYDASTSVASNATLSGLVTGEGLVVSVATANSSHVSANSSNFITGLTLANGSGLVDNYSLQGQDLASGAPITGLTRAFGGDNNANTVTINQRTLQLTMSGTLSKEYDGSADGEALLPTFTASNLVGDHAVTITRTGTATFNSANVLQANTLSVTGLAVSALTGTGPLEVGNYSWNTDVSASASITARQLSLSGSKTYDGNTNLSTVTLGNYASGETLNYSNAVLSLKDAGTRYLTGLTLANNATYLASNYKLPDLTAVSAANTVTINRAALTVSASRIYDGTTDVTASTTLSGRVGSETLTVTSATANSSNVSGNATNFINSLTLADGTGLVSNYTLQGHDLSAGVARTGLSHVDSVNTVSLSARPLTITLANTNVSKVYDGNTSAKVGNNTAENANIVLSFVAGNQVSGDNLTVTGTAAYNSADVFDATTLNVSAISVTGISASTAGSQVTDYSWNTSTSVAASITARPLAVLGGAGVSKVYDGTTSMGTLNLSFSGTGQAESGLVAGQTLSVTGGTGSFSTASAGSGKAYSVTSPVLTGTAVTTNYSIPGAGGTITGNDGLVYKRPLNVTLSGVEKVYDGTTVATGGTIGYDNAAYAPVVINGVTDDVTVNYTGTFSSKNVGANIPLTLSNVTLSGAQAGNYHVTVNDADPLQKEGVRDNAGLATSTGVITQRDSVTWVGGSTGNWFDPSNWAATSNLGVVGVVPDLSNVATVVIPSGVTVSFADTVRSGLAEAGAVSIAALSGGGGNLNLSAGTLNVGAGGTSLGGFVQTAGSLASTGDFTVTDSFSQTDGTLSTTGAGADININQTTGALGWSNISAGGDLTVAAPGDLTMGATSVGGNLSATSAAMTQTGVLTVAGTSSLTAGAGNDITLINSGNNFTGAVNVISGRNVSLTDINAVVLGAVNASGSLAVNAVGVSQTADGVAVGTTSSINAGAGALVLGSANNALIGAVSLQNSGAHNVALNNSLATDLSASSLGSGTLGITSGGEITQSGALTQAADAGAVSLAAGAHAVSLNHAGNNFTGIVSASGSTVSLRDTNSLSLGTVTASGNLSLQSGGALNLGTSNAGGNLTVTSGGAVSQTGALTVAGTTSLTATGQTVTLDDEDNNFEGVVTLAAEASSLRDKDDLSVVLNTTGNTSVQADGALAVSGSVAGATSGLTTTTGSSGTTSFGATTVGGNLSVTSAGAVTQTAALGVGGSTSLTAGANDISLAQASNDFTGAVSVVSANHVQLADTNALDLGTSTVSGNLTVTTGGALTDSGTLLITGTTALNATGQTVSLDSAANNFGGAVSATGAAVTLVDGVGGLTLGNVTASSLNATSTGGAIVDADDATVNVTGTTALTASNAGVAADVALNNLSNNFGSTVNASGAAVTLVDGSGGLTLGNVTAATLTASSTGGAISQDASGTNKIVVTGTSTLNASQISGASVTDADISLAGTTNDFGGAVTATGAAITLADANALTTVLDASGNSNLAAGGNLSVSGSTLGLNTTTTGTGATDFGATTVAGNLIASSAGAVTQTGALAVTGTTGLTATGADQTVTLTNSGNDLAGVVTITAGATALTNAHALNVVLATTGDTVLTADGPLSVSGAVTGVGSDLQLNASQINFGITAVGGNLSTSTTGAGALGGVAQTGALTVGGSASFETPSGALQTAQLNAALNNFVGPVSFGQAGAGTWSGVSVVDGAGGLILGNVTAGSLTVSSTGGAIADADGTTVNVAGNTSLTASSGDAAANITLDNASHNFGGTVNATGAAVTLADGSGGLILGNVTASSLNATSTGGAISDAVGATVNVTGTTALTASNSGVAADVALDNATNNLVGAVSASGAAVTLVDGSGGLTLGNVNAGTLNASSTDGAITQDTSGTNKVVVTDAITLSASQVSGSTVTAADISLGGTTNNLGSTVNATGAAVTLVDGVGGLSLGNVTASSLNATSTGGALSDADDATLNVSGATTLAASSGGAAASITVDNASNTLTGPVSATGSNVNLSYANGDLVLGNVTASSLNATTTGGAISDAVGATVNVTGTTALAASSGGVAADVVLDNATNNFGNTVNATGGNLTLVDGVGDLVLGAVTATGLLDATASGSLTMTGAVSAASADLASTAGAISQGENGTMAVSGTAALQAATAITLDKANDFGGTVNVLGATGVTLNDTAGGLILGNVTTSGTLGATATGNVALNGAVAAAGLNASSTGGAISQGENGTMAVSGTAALQAATAITLGKANDFGGTVNASGTDLVLNSIGNLTLGTVSAAGTLDLASQGNLDLGQTSVAGGLTVDSGNGNITQSGALQVGGFTTMSAGNGSLSLTHPNNTLSSGVAIQAARLQVQGDRNQEVAAAFEKVLSSLPLFAPVMVAKDIVPPPHPMVMSIQAPVGISVGTGGSLSSATQSNGASTSLVSNGNSAGVSVTLPNGAPSAGTTVMTAVSLPKGLATSGSGFSFQLPESVRALLKFAINTPDAVLANGDPLPQWLKLDPVALRFEASAVPTTGLPLQVILTIGSERVVVVVSERAE